MKNCITCNNIMGPRAKKYCSIKCQKDFEWLKRKFDIISANAIPFTYDGNRRAGRKFIGEQRGWKCEICGLHEWMGVKIPLVLDHINGNSDDWKLSNLRLICCNCDAQTETYKSRNIGNGRYSRRKRYIEGKSF